MKYCPTAVTFADPTDLGSAKEALSILLKFEIRPHIRAQLQSYGTRFTYDARARQLLDRFTAAG